MSTPPDLAPRHELVTIKSGAVAVRSLDAGEVMHPGIGPLREAEELYIAQSRLATRLAARDVTLFDIGLGAGTNALAARAVSEATTGTGRLQLVSFENDLGALALALANPGAFAIVDEAAAAARALVADGRHATARTTWTLRQGDLLAALDVEPTRADLVFWDPFSPRANPALWTIAAFTALRRAAGPRCALYTYSGSTRVRLALLLAGWAVGAGVAIGDKAQTTVAAIEVDDLERPLDRAWLGKRGDPSTPWPGDAPAGALGLIEKLRQFAR